jgi:RimJ/RimL family protein N-acetyltransferase
MMLYFRRLVAADIPAVIDLTKDIWEGTDYMPNVIDRWIQHEKNYTFGAFSDQAMHEMIGVAQVRWFSPGVAWLEGGRVRPSAQKQGVGIQIAEHAIEHVRARGGKTCLYDTSSENHGSIAIAKRYGFIERDRVRVSILDSQNARFEQVNHPGKVLKFLPAKEAIAAARRMPNPPREYISNGWSPPVALGVPRQGRRARHGRANKHHGGITRTRHDMDNRPR